MARTTAFDRYTDRYDQWFVQHDGAYLSELSAVRSMLPQCGLGVEIGVGTARFAGPLKIPIGLDPSRNVLRKAHDRQVHAVCGFAEALPFADQVFDYCLFVTAICFVEDVENTIREARRVLNPSGELVIGFIDRDSPIGQYYLAHQSQGVFYRSASIYSARDVGELLVASGFEGLQWAQTLFKGSSDSSVIEPTRPGYGEGSFVVVKATPRIRSSDRSVGTRVIAKQRFAT
jgi:SAM-dependent methyltransferase